MLMWITIVLLLIVAMISLFIGRYTLSFPEIMTEVLHDNGRRCLSAGFSVIFNLRLPRIIAVMMVGAGLSVAGVTYQAVLRNALGEPGCARYIFRRSVRRSTWDTARFSTTTQRFFLFLLWHCQPFMRDGTLPFQEKQWGAHDYPVGHHSGFGVYVFCINY